VAAEHGRIEARLSTFDTAMVVFSLVVGIGIFRTPAIVAQATGERGLFYAAWVIGGVASLIGAFTFAEIGARHPRAGGYYRVVADCYHPALAFALNWSQTLMQGAGAAGVALIGAEYLVPVVLPAAWRTPRAPLVLACATMLVLLLLNYRGVRLGARTQNLLSLLKIAMICALALTAFAIAPHATEAPAPAGPWPPRLATALIPCFYAFGGYQLTMNLGGDVRDAGRRLPRAITLGMLTVIALYLLLNLAYERVLGIAGIASSQLVAAALSRALFGRFAEVVVSVAIFLSAAGFVNATIMQMPRGLMAMAEDRVLPQAFRRVNASTQTQEAALLFFGATLLLPAFVLGSFENLMNYVMATDTVTLAVVASTLFVLRRRGAATAGFVMPGYPLLPALYLLALLVVAVSVFAATPAVALGALVILVAGGPLYLLGRRLFGGAPAG